MVRPAEEAPAATDPLWYKDAVVYELHVRSFQDSNADGIGDFPGLTSRLDYLRDLGVTALWLLPFYPSPLRDDGYDIADYMDLNPEYGTLRDFRTFLREAHAKEMRVITELVLNHTSDQHGWFQRARRAAPGSVERNFYVWSDSPDRFTKARIIFPDFETSNWSWDPVARSYYWHRFYSHQPDLNYDNPAVVDEMFKVLDFWLGLGVDGIRLDAIPYLFKRDGTNCENLPETHEFIRRLRRHVDERFRGRMLLAEANQWPEDAAAYFGPDGEECHTAFHFPLMPRLFMATRMETRYPVTDILEQTPAIPPTSQWFLFLRNHDELSLEMVTDEERDYMYRVYAADARMRLNLGIRRRLAPLLSNDRRLIDLMHGLLFSLPGTPVLYYGDEIGMGDNVYLGDRNGVRTPMQWSADRNAGFSRANPQQLPFPIIIDPEYHYEAFNVEALQANPHSLLWQVKRLLALRRQTGVFGRGTFALLRPDNPRVLAFVREYEGRTVLVVANLSHLIQHSFVDLGRFRGSTPVELFGQNRFPTIGDAPYPFTLGAYDVFWFSLAAPAPAGERPVARPEQRPPVTLPFEGTFPHLQRPEVRAALEAALPEFLQSRRWFRGKSHLVERVRLREMLALARADGEARIAIVDVDFVDTESQAYVLPLGFGEPESTNGARSEEARASAHVIARFRPPGGGPVRELVETGDDPEFHRLLVEHIAHDRGAQLESSAVEATHLPSLTHADVEGLGTLPIRVFAGEQSNTSAQIGDRFMLKLYRALGGGANPELEIGEHLARRAVPSPTAPLVGSIRYRKGLRSTESLAVLHRYIKSEGGAWDMTLTQLRGFFDRAQAFAATGRAIPGERPSLDDPGPWTPSEAVIELIGPYLELARVLGVRTAELHHLLADEAGDPRFRPEPFDVLYLRSIYQRMQAARGRTLDQLRATLPRLSEDVLPLARLVLDQDMAIAQRFRTMLSRPITGQRIRIHGDYHLGQVLWTGKDFVIIDFEGEPMRALSERRIKRSGLRDVAGLVRSFDYAMHVALRAIAPSTSPDAHRTLLATGRFWVDWVSWTYLEAYRAATAGAPFVPSDPQDFAMLLDAYIVEKALYELRYELDNRPDWIEIPIRGVLRLLRAEP